jgi:hypothetical protein
VCPRGEFLRYSEALQSHNVFKSLPYSYLSFLKLNAYAPLRSPRDMAGLLYPIRLHDQFEFFRGSHTARYVQACAR